VFIRCKRYNLDVNRNILEALSEVIVESIINDIEERLVRGICEPIARKIVAEVQG